MNKLWIVILSLFLVGCSPNEGSHIDEIRGDDSRAKSCSHVVDEKRIFKTASKFSLIVPDWTLSTPQENSFNANCEITSLKLHLAYIDGRIVPIPHRKPSPPNQITLPKSYDKLSLYFKFRDPNQDILVNDKNSCSNKTPIYEYEDFGFRICPFLLTQENPNIDTLPFYPRFELMDKETNPTWFTCRHEDLNGYTLKNIYEAVIPFRCRGYWHWRKGASAMFDLSKGQVLKKAYQTLRETEVLLNSWVIQETK